MEEIEAARCGLEFGATYRVRRDQAALRDNFRAGELVTYWRHGYSRHDGYHGFFFRQPGTQAVRSWDVEDVDPVAREALFERVSGPHVLIGAARTGDVAEVAAALPGLRGDEASLVLELAIEAAIDAKQPSTLPSLLGPQLVP